MSKPNPTYYAIIPAYVRYNQTLTSTAKLLFGEITALANTQGFCSASNSYFANLYGVTPRHISDLVSSLVGEGCITVEVDQDAGNKRKIRLLQPMELNPDRYGTKSGDPYGTKSGDNNTSNNIRTPTPLDATDIEHSIKQIYQLYLKYFIVPTFDLAGYEAKDRAYIAMDAAVKRYRLTTKRREAIKRRLDDAGLDMLKAAVVGYGKSEWHTGTNNRNWVAGLDDFICRSYEKVEEGARLYENSKKSSDDAWSKL